MSLVELIRGGARLPVNAFGAIGAGDALILRDTPAGLRDAATAFGAELFDSTGQAPFIASDDDDDSLGEVVIGTASSLVGSMYSSWTARCNCRVHRWPGARCWSCSWSWRLAGCVKFDGLGRALSPAVVLLVASSVALPHSIVTTGAAARIADGVSALVVIMLVTLSVLMARRYGF